MKLMSCISIINKALGGQKNSLMVRCWWRIIKIW
jgi:hypothetical protein